MEVSDHGEVESLPLSSSATTAAVDGGPSSSSAPSTSLVQQEGNDHENHHHHHNQSQRHLERPSVFSYRRYRVNISISDATRTELRDDVLSSVVVLVAFWFFASMILILGFHGSMNFRLGPNCARLIQTNHIFVQSIQVEEIDENKPGPALYGFYKPPPLDVEIAWTETHTAYVPANFHEEWAHFLNEGSKVDIFYNVKSHNSSPLSLVIAEGKDNLLEWIDDPSYRNTTLSWHIISGSGKIQQKISTSANYYIAVGNFDTEEVKVELKFNINAVIYNTSKAYYKCSLGDRLCNLKLFLVGENTALLTTPGPEEGFHYEDWYVKLSYGPRWITYFVGSGVMTAFIFLSFRFSNILHNDSTDSTQVQTEELGPERTPLLLTHKDDDVLSWGSSYDSLPHDEKDLEEWLPTEGNSANEREISNNNNTNTRRLCIICFDSSRDCFFLPCGHCAACFTCATRIAEEAGTCPICRRKMKKVRKIFTV